MRLWIHVLLLVSALAAATAFIRGRPSRSGNTITYSSCSIKNKRFGTYFYAAGDYFKRSGLRRVFLWRPGNNIRENSWEIKSCDGGRTWRIRNKYWNQYLYAASAKYDNYRRYVNTHPASDSESYWRISSVDGGRFVTLFSNRYYDYMYADGQKTWDSQRRRVFTWMPGKPGGIHWEECKWEIDC